MTEHLYRAARMRAAKPSPGIGIRHPAAASTRCSKSAPTLARLGNHPSTCGSTISQRHQAPADAVAKAAPSAYSTRPMIACSRDRPRPGAALWKFLYLWTSLRMARCHSSQPDGAPRNPGRRNLPSAPARFQVRPRTRSAAMRGWAPKAKARLCGVADRGQRSRLRCTSISAWSSDQRGSGTLAGVCKRRCH